MSSLTSWPVLGIMLHPSYGMRWVPRIVVVVGLTRKLAKSLLRSRLRLIGGACWMKPHGMMSAFAQIRSLLALARSGISGKEFGSREGEFIPLSRLVESGIPWGWIAAVTNIPNEQAVLRTMVRPEEYEALEELFGISR